MNILQRLDTPFKRISFLVMLAGVVTLAGSLLVWTQQGSSNKIYYSRDHYNWVPVDSKDQVCVESRWSWNSFCAKSFSKARITEVKQEIKERHRINPEKFGHEYNKWVELTSEQRISDSCTSFNYMAMVAALGEPLINNSELSAALYSIIELHQFDACSAREGKILQEIFQTPDINYLAGRRASPSPKEVCMASNRQKKAVFLEEDFKKVLYEHLELDEFPLHQRDEIFNKCAEKTDVTYTWIETTYHSDIEDWPEDHPAPFILGWFMVTAGLFFAFFQGAVRAVVQGTAGRLIAWIRTGNPKPPSGPPEDKDLK